MEIWKLAADLFLDGKVEEVSSMPHRAKTARSFGAKAEQGERRRAGVPRAGQREAMSLFALQGSGTARGLEEDWMGWYRDFVPQA